MSSPYAFYRVDESLADGVYELVAEQGGDLQLPEGEFDLEQDPNQSSEEPKAAEGKHRSMAHIWNLLCNYG